ncbi:MAG: hypothetical protein P8Y97_17280, partial [Candidatus Lokiarchaeota archaeon]
MLGNSIEIKFEKVKEGQHKIGIMEEFGNSMPQLAPGGNVPYVKHKLGMKYEVGDIIVYRLQSGVNVYHVVIGYEDKGNTRVYETQGINNRYPDSDRVYENQLIGQIVRFSESELAFLIEMAERGRIPYIKGLGMSELVGKVQKFIHEVVNDFFDETGNANDEQLMLERIQNGADPLDIMVEIMQKMSTSEQNPNNVHISDNFINKGLRQCIDFVLQANILPSYAANLFAQMCYKLFENPGGAQLESNIKIITEILKSSSKFQSLDVLIADLKSKVSNGEISLHGSEFINQEYLNRLIARIWNVENYDKLFIKQKR